MMRAGFYRRLELLRRATQLFSFAFLFALPVLVWQGVHWIVGSLYSISIGSLVIADPAMALQTTLLTREVYVPLLFAALLPAVLALVFGRVFCSWLCPYNTLLDWAERAWRRLRGKGWQKARLAAPSHNPHPGFYWAVFAALVLAATVLGLPLLSYLSAPGILSTQISQTILGMGTGLEIGLVVLLLVAEVGLGRRFWCKYGCPVGATLSLFRTRRTLHVAHGPSHCTCPPGGEACRVACPLGLAPAAGDVRPYCYNCGSCLATCEKLQRNALHFRFGPAPGLAVTNGAAVRHELHAVTGARRSSDSVEEVSPS